MTIQIIPVPDLGGADNVEVIEICVSEGDRVSEDQSLVVLESDKATMEVPCPQAGVVGKLLLKVGDKVVEGKPVLELQVEASGDSVQSSFSDEKVSAAEVSKADKTADDDGSFDNASEDAGDTLSAPAIQEVIIPDLGGVDQVSVIEVLVQAGDAVSVDQSLLVLESDKASMEVPCPYEGIVKSVVVSLGQEVKAGDRLATIEMQGGGAPVKQSGGQAKSAPPASSVVEPQTDAVDKRFVPQPGELSTEMPEILDEGDRAFHKERQQRARLESEVQAERLQREQRGGFYAGPAVRKLARELGVELAKVKGNGPRNRVLKDDLFAYVKQAMNQPAQTGGGGIPPLPTVDFTRFGEIEKVPLTRIEKLTANNMQRSWLNVPHVTQFDEADMTAIESFRKDLRPEMEKRDIKLTPIVFLLKACATALREFPRFNSSLDNDGEQLVYKRYIHIGVAVDTPAGLMVPVIRDVEEKGLWELAAELKDLSMRARDGKLKPAEMQGGCFTISSLGAIGGQGFTPIINAPEVAILGVSRSAVKPVWDGSSFIPKTLLPLALSYDHRVINGADAGRFFSFLLEEIADIRKMLL